MNICNIIKDNAEFHMWKLYLYCTVTLFEVIFNILLVRFIQKWAGVTYHCVQVE
jgi:hypothetical protein